MTSKANAATSIHNQIVAQQDKITQMNKDIDQRSFDNLEEELEGIMVSMKSYLFAQGS